MNKTVRCQEEVSSDKSSTYKNLLLEKDTRQCKRRAQYLIKHIELYVCVFHAKGIDKSRLDKLK
jgi:hypothetical protein